MPRNFISPWKRLFLACLLVTAVLAGCGGDDPSPPEDQEGNQPPAARAGADRTVAVGEVVNLDGSASFDPENDPLTFSWSFLARPAGSTASFTDPTFAKPVFTVDLPGEYRIALSVSDGLFSDQDVVIVTTSKIAEDQRPVAIAGFDRRVHVLTPVQLDGSRSFDPEGDVLSYEWVILAQPSNSFIFIPDLPNPSFTPLVLGEYKILLVVRDRLGNTGSDLITITAVPVTENIGPVAIAGRDQIVSIGNLVTLDGSGSFDPTGNPLSFSWKLTGRPESSLAALAESATSNPFFTPDVPGSYLAQVTVQNLRGATDSASLAITVLPSGENVPPVAIIRVDRFAVVGLLVAIDGSSSFDPDGSQLTFAWLLLPPRGSGAVLVDAESPFPSFTADFPGEFGLQLTVTDAFGGRHSEFVAIQVR